MVHGTALIPNETQFPYRTLVARLAVTRCKLLPGAPKKVEVMEPFSFISTWIAPHAGVHAMAAVV